MLTAANLTADMGGIFTNNTSGQPGMPAISWWVIGNLDNNTMHATTIPSTSTVRQRHNPEISRVTTAQQSLLQRRSARPYLG
jgi:hypothetical protein